MLFQILQTDKRFGTSQFVEIVIVIIVVIRVMSLKEGFNRVVRRGVGEVEACGRISSFPLPTSSSQPAVSSCTIQSTVAGLALQCSHCTHLLKSVSGLLAALQNHCTVYYTTAHLCNSVNSVLPGTAHTRTCSVSSCVNMKVSRGIVVQCLQVIRKAGGGAQGEQLVPRRQLFSG